MPFLAEREPDAGLAPLAPDLLSVTPELGLEAKGVAETLGAAFRQENILVNGARWAAKDKDFGDADPEHDPLPLIEGTPVETYWESFIGSRNEAQTRSIIAEVEAELKDRETLAAAGNWGMAAAMLAGTLDLPTLLPAGAIVRSLKVGRAAARSALVVGGANTGASAMSEALLHATQRTRTLEESLFNIGGSFVLGGVLGGSVSALSSARFKSLARALEGEAKIPKNSADDPFGTGGVDKAQENFEAKSTAAARSPDAPDNVLEGALGMEKVFSFQDPVLRSLNSPLKSVRDITTRLVETTLGLEQNNRFIPTGPAGGSVETRIKTQGVARLGQAMEAIEEAYAKYYFGKPKAFAKGIRAGANRVLRKDPRLTFGEFNREIGRAARRKDKHDIPEVDEAAKAVRRLFVEPIKDDAIEQNLLPEGVTPVGAESYLTRAYNKEKIKAETPAFREILVNHLRRGQGAAIRDLFDLERTLDHILNGGGDVSVTLQDMLEAFRRDLGNLSDVDNIVDIWKIVKDAPKKPPQSLAQFVRSGGGLKDQGGEVSHLTGGVSDRLLNNKSGQTLDDAALRAWEEGFLQGLERPTINDFLEALGNDLSGSPVVRLDDLDAFDGWALGQEFRPTLEVMGLDRVRTEAGARKRAAKFIDSLGAAEDVPGFERGNVNSQAFDVESLPEAFFNLLLARDPVTLRNAFDSFSERLTGNSTFEARRARVMAAAAQAEELRNLRLERRSDVRQLRSQIREVRDFADLEPELLGEIANDVIAEIMGTPNGLNLYRSKAGPLHQRTLTIRDEEIENFLESDMKIIARHYARTMVPDIELTRQFGDLELSRDMKQIRIEADEKIAHATSKKEVAKINKAAEKAQRDIQAMVDRLRGRYGIPDDPTSVPARALRATKSVNYLRLLGGMTLSAIPDVFRTVMVHGVTRNFEGLGNLITNMQAVKLTAKETKLAGTALDMVLDTRSQSIADVMDEFGRYSKFERALEMAQNEFGMVSLMAPWNTMAKQWAGLITQTNLLDTATKIAAGGRVTKKAVKSLASAGIDENMARRIADQFNTHGAKIRGVFVAQTQKWTDRLARDAFRGAIARDVDRIIVTPGQDRPLLASKGIGQLAFQFKSFVIGSMQRTLIAGLQQRDAGVLIGALGMIGAGVLVEYLKSFTNQKPLPDNTAQWVATAMDRSGLFAYLFEANHFLEMTTGGRLGVAPLTGRRVSRFASRNIGDAFVGPTGGLVRDLTRASGAAFNGEFSEADFRALRRAIPFQNLFYMAWLLRKLEKGLTDSLPQTIQ